ncbi:MAG: glycoside hydrolase family 28 protein [Clostridia bacterium]|nr:glycoside hydrolase family 28 protein [Clostridia bacterium]
MQIYHSQAGGEVTLWWEKSGPEDGEYTVYEDGAPVGKTQKTHFTLPVAEDAEIGVKSAGGDEGAIGFVYAPPFERISALDFGAKGDGVTLNTRALQNAIDALKPGQELYLPAGTYLTGALDLHGDMALYLEKGAVLQGTADVEDYTPKIPSRFEGYEMMCYRSLLNLGRRNHAAGANCKNVLIYGKGTISGGGQALCLNVIKTERELMKEYLQSLGDKIKEYENDHTIPARPRGRLINLSNCENVRITGLTLQNGASWNVHMLYSKHIVTDHCVFKSEDVWNGDGWDPDSSEDCTLFGCEFFTGDDSVAIKSGKNPEGNVIGRPTRRVRVFDCLSHKGLGIAIGSEMSGGVEDVKIWDCDLINSLYGVQIKATKKRGGYVRDVSVSDCRLSRFEICAVKYNDDGEGSPVPPAFENISLNNCYLSGWARNYWEKEDRRIEAVDISGFGPDHPARGIRIRNCTLGPEASIKLSACEDVTLDVRKAE